MLKQTQAHKQIQKLLPQIIQKQSLLTINTLALEQIVKQEIINNPLLEEIDESAEQNEKNDDSDNDLEFDEKKVTSEDEEFDTDSYVDSDMEGFKTYDYNEKENKFNYDNLWTSRVSMKDNLLTQLHLSDITEKDILIGEEIISALDDEGYFRDDPADIAQDLEINKVGTKHENEKFTVDDVIRVLKLIQTFEPVGIASRNLQECLLIQLEESATDFKIKNICKEIINNKFEEFRLKNYEKLMKELNISAEVLNRAFDIIHKLNPKPGALLDISESVYIIPDIILKKEENEYRIEINDRGIPTLKISNAYKNILDSQISNKDEKEFVKNNYDRAKWFIDSILSRRETMIKVMSSILKRQYDFFESNGKHLKPMLEKDVAEDIGMDISTVSRTVRGKYVQTDFGIYELKFFFSYHIRSSNGDDISNKLVKEKIQEIVDNESKDLPLTDDEISKELNKFGLKIARRTVTKYRESLNISKARLRRKL